MNLRRSQKLVCSIVTTFMYVHVFLVFFSKLTDRETSFVLRFHRPVEFANAEVSNNEREKKENNVDTRHTIEEEAGSIRQVQLDKTVTG